MAVQMKPIKHLLKNTDISRSLSRDEFMRQTEALSLAAVAALDHDRLLAKMAAVEVMVQRSSIPARYRHADLGKPASLQQSAYARVCEYAFEFEVNKKSGAGLLFVGDIGTGKTHLACALANDLMRRLVPVLYCTVLEAVMLIKRSWHRSSSITEFDAYEQFTRPDLLILDEVGVQHGSDFEAMALTSIIDARARACLPTVALSNHDPAGVMQVIGERAFDRLMGYGGQVIEMRGPSLRRHGVNGE